MEDQTHGFMESTYRHGKKQVKVKVSIIIFEEDNSTIVYCPALDLSGYGSDEREALDAFKTVTLEYLKYRDNKNTLFQDLSAHGWVIPKHSRQKLAPPPMSELLTNNNEFNRVFNNLPFKKIDEEFAIPA